MELNHTNYYTLDNKYISNSKLSAYIYNPYYFYKKYITGEIKTKITDPMIIGKAVDLWLTGSEQSFRETYELVGRRTRDNDWEYQLNPTMADTVIKICEEVQNLEVYKYIKKHKFISQEIFKLDTPIGRFPGLCGIPDFYKIEKNTCTIIDLKTANSTDRRKFYWHAKDLGYFRQQAMYQKLIRARYNISKFNSYLLVAEKSDKGYNRNTLFKVDQLEVDNEKENIELLLEQLSQEQFKVPKITWDTAVMLNI